jgi:hypothetical protein
MARIKITLYRIEEYINYILRGLNQGEYFFLQIDYLVLVLTRSLKP